MSRYNQQLDRAIEEWTAMVHQSPDVLVVAREGVCVFLKAKDAKKELFVDTLQFLLRRTEGLKLILME